MWWVRLVSAAAGGGERDTEPDHREPADAADQPQPPRGPGEPRPHGARGHPVADVRGHADQHGHRAENQHLGRHVPGRPVDELRQHGGEQDHALRVRDPDEEALAHRLHAATGLGGLGEHAGQRAAPAERHDAEPDQVDGPGQPDHGEDGRRALDDRPDAEGHAHRQHVVPGGMPRHRRQRRAAAMRQGPADHEQDAGPGDDNQHHRSGREPRKLPCRNHIATITPAGDPISLTGSRGRPGHPAETSGRPDNPYRIAWPAWTPGGTSGPPDNPSRDRAGGLDTWLMPGDSGDRFAEMTRAGLAAAIGVAREHGLPAGDPEVLSSRGNVLVHLRPAPVVARVATLTAWTRSEPFQWLAREVAVAGYAAANGGPVVPPTALTDPGPHWRDGLAVSLWTFVPPSPERPAPAEFGVALARLHMATADFPGELPVLATLRAQISDALAALERDHVLEPGVLTALRDRHAEILAALDGPDGPDGPELVLHGDAHPGNLLWTPAGWLWTDLEETCRGPRAFDLAVLVRRQVRALGAVWRHEGAILPVCGARSARQPGGLRPRITRPRPARRLRAPGRQVRRHGPVLLLARERVLPAEQAGTRRARAGRQSGQLRQGVHLPAAAGADRGRAADQRG